MSSGKPQQRIVVTETGRHLGDGAYATVREYDFRGLKCAGKSIHHSLYANASPHEINNLLRRFEEECELLSRLHHPNIVQFLGVHLEARSEVQLPVLVMEYLPTNLSGYLDRHGVPPADISYSILRDVALGLRYLHEHSPPIVHRDLSANNVLLTASLSAKISDLGVAKILNTISPSKMTSPYICTRTQVPGTPSYMPPEVMIDHPKYTHKIDCYSFGVMILHVLCAKWPLPSSIFQTDPDNPDKLVIVKEVDRRAEFLQEIGHDHPLSGLVYQCLSDAPTQRPEAAVILQEINTVISCPVIAVPKWRRVPDVPKGMVRSQAVVRGEKVYVGGGFIADGGHQVFLYNWKKEKWGTLPNCPTKWFAMAEFLGRIIVVGGNDIHDSHTGKVFALSEEFKRWEEFLPPMPTARDSPLAVTTSTAIVTAGGDTGFLEASDVVEVYCSHSSQWYIADPMPKPCYDISAVAIDNTWYLLGGEDGSRGINECFCVSILSLIEKATSSHPHSSSRESVWNLLPSTPHKRSNIVHLSGTLMAVGGKDDSQAGSPTTAVYALRNDSWVQLNKGDLPVPRAGCTTVKISSNMVLVIGGGDKAKKLSSEVFLGTL